MIRGLLSLAPGVVLAAGILSGCGCSGSGLELVVAITPGDRLCVWEETYDVEEGERSRFDLVAQAVIVENRGEETVQLESTLFELFQGGTLIQSLLQRGTDIEPGIAYVAGLEEQGLRRSTEWTFGLDQALEVEVSLSATRVIEPLTAAVIPNTRLYSPSRPDSLRVTGFAVTGDGGQLQAQATVSIESCEASTRFSFPLEGKWYVTGEPGLLRASHRYNLATEFAVDMIKLGSDSEVWGGDVTLKSSFFGLGEKVLAAADGIVVDLNRKATQTWHHVTPAPGESDDSFKARRLAEKVQAVNGDHRQLVSGNYVVLEHENLEFSSYHHLKEGGVHVEIGQNVHRGQHIGDVGNTGDGFLVHLHFQVSDGPIEKSRSLPFRFEDVEVRPWQPGYLMKATRPGIREK